MKSIVLPPKRTHGNPETWTAVHSVVITGANGSGKTRLGVWIEDNNTPRNVHRIAAQRALQLPDLAQPMPYERAASQLYYGTYEPDWNENQRLVNKRHTRWGGQPDLQMLSDYALVVSTLFADETRRNREYTNAARASVPTTPPPECSLDVLQRIWAVIFPHRELVIGQDRVSARIPDGDREYAGRMMSDGERVTFYLLGQVLSAPKDAIVVIDEPEIHLHRAVLSPLWDEAERCRPDCTFVYVTHDLEFAGTRTSARKVWARAYDGTNWEWEEVEPVSQLPDELVFQVLGSRRPVLFVEGDLNSLDTALYRILFPGKFILPVADCQQVIRARLGMSELNSLHNLAIDGLVDRDHRSSDEIKALRDEGIMVADVAEVENLFCMPSVLLAVAKQLHNPDPDGAVQKAQARVLAEFHKSINTQAAAFAIAEIQFMLNGFGPKAGKSNIFSLQADLKSHVAGIDVPRIFESAYDLFQNTITSGDYDAALRFYNCKGMISFVAHALGTTSAAYCNIVMGIVSSPQGLSIVEELRSRIF